MITSSRFFEILSRARDKRVAVIGDFMLDRHVQGIVKRISPEAPVPVVEIEDERSSLGGAGNVIANLASLGVAPLAFGVCGKDNARNLMLEHLANAQCDCRGLLEITERKTTEKIRVIAHDQHVVRVDRESVEPLSDSTVEALLNALDVVLDTLDAIILQDYNKGVLSPRVIARALEVAESRGIPVAVDPKFDNFAAFKRAHLFKPNLREAERALGMVIRDDAALREACAKLLTSHEPDILMITRGEKGMTICTRERETTIPTRARDVADVSGAGDTVISTFVVAELGGADMIEAATLANCAAGVVCEQVGVVPVDQTDLAAALERAE